MKSILFCLIVFTGYICAHKYRSRKSKCFDANGHIYRYKERKGSLKITYCHHGYIDTSTIKTPLVKCTYSFDNPQCIGANNRNYSRGNAICKSVGDDVKLFEFCGVRHYGCCKKFYQLNKNGSCKVFILDRNYFDLSKDFWKLEEEHSEGRKRSMFCMFNRCINLEFF